MYLIVFDVGDICKFDWVSIFDDGVWMTCWEDKYCWFEDDEHVDGELGVCWRR